MCPFLLKLHSHFKMGVYIMLTDSLEPQVAIRGTAGVDPLVSLFFSTRERNQHF